MSLKHLVPIIMGSEIDMDHAKKIGDALVNSWNIPVEYRISSAHKTPELVTAIVNEYDRLGINIVYVTVAGRTDALSGYVASNTTNPNIACPPPPKDADPTYLFSSLNAPGDSPVMVVKDPKNAALAVAKILAMSDIGILNKYLDHIGNVKKKIAEADQKVYSPVKGKLICCFSAKKPGQTINH